MTKEITKAIILQQIQDKMKLRDFEPAKFLFDETVVPTLDIGIELQKPKAKLQTVSVTSMGGKNFYTVPQNEKWYLHTYNVVFMAAGAYKVTGVYLTRTEYPTNAVYLDMVEGQTVSYAVHLPLAVPLFSGDILSVMVDEYTSTADLRLYIDYLVEEIR